MYVEEENDIWKNYATILGADFKPIDYWHSPKISKVYQGIKVVFDGYFHATTVSSPFGSRSYESFSIRAGACFDSSTTFRFKISKNIFSKGWINWIFPKRFKTGDISFDNLFRFKTNDKVILGQLLEDVEIRNLLKSLEEVNLQISIYEGIWGDPLPDGKLELAYYRQGRTINIHELKKLDNLYEKLIHKLFSLKIIPSSKIS